MAFSILRFIWLWESECQSLLIKENLFCFFSFFTFSFLFLFFLLFIVVHIFSIFFFFFFLVLVLLSGVLLYAGFCSYIRKWHLVFWDSFDYRKVSAKPFWEIQAGWVKLKFYLKGYLFKTDSPSVTYLDNLRLYVFRNLKKKHFLLFSILSSRMS